LFIKEVVDIGSKSAQSISNVIYDHKYDDRPSTTHSIKCYTESRARVNNKGKHKCKHYYEGIRK